MLIINSSGTVLAANTSYLVPDEALTDEERVSISNSSDSEIARIGRENGFPVEHCERLLQIIADILWYDGEDSEWSADTPEAIAEAIEVLRPDLKAARS